MLPLLDKLCEFIFSAMYLEKDVVALQLKTLSSYENSLLQC